MSEELRIFVPRLMDAGNTNAQNLNARALLSRFTSTHARWVSSYYDEPDSRITAAPRVELNNLWRTRLWHWHMLLEYQGTADAVFYPGLEWFDARGLELRERFGRRVPVIGTLEGLIGNDDRERQIEETVGHKVHCHRVSEEVLERCDRILGACDHIIAITPMLVKIGERLYGKKVSLLPLGIDAAAINRLPPRNEEKQFRVVIGATVTERKRPFVFLELARRFPSVDFAWFGTGPLLDNVHSAIAEARIANLTFPGGRSPDELAKEFSRSDLVVLPSLSEGAPKVLQEAAACGLPRIAFGFYEPSIEDGVDGFIVWNDDELFARVDELVHNPGRARAMGLKGAAKASTQDWNLIAPQWENEVLNKIYQLRAK